MAESIEGPEQDEYPPIPRERLDSVAGRIAARMQVRIQSEHTRHPTRIGDRSARLRAVTDEGAIVFIKMVGTWHETTRSFFRHEIRVLEALNGSPPGSFLVPSLLDYGDESGVIWMATEWVEASEDLHLSEATFMPLVDALQAMRALPAQMIVGHACQKRHHPWGKDTYWANIQETTRRLSLPGVALLSPTDRDKIMRFMNQCIDDLDDLPVAPAHGDFAPGNLGFRGGRVAVLDWESSHLDRGPIDLAHFVSTRHAWRSVIASRLEAALWPNGPHEVLTLAKIERLAGRANDTYQRRREIDVNALEMLRELVRHLP